MHRPGSSNDDLHAPIRGHFVSKLLVSSLITSSISLDLIWGLGTKEVSKIFNFDLKSLEPCQNIIVFKQSSVKCHKSEPCNYRNSHMHAQKQKTIQLFFHGQHGKWRGSCVRAPNDANSVEHGGHTPPKAKSCSPGLIVFI